METFKIHTKNKEESKAVKAVLKALKIPFESIEESPYKSKFVDKIKRSEAEAREGKLKTIKTEDLWK
ncbi:DUF2683 family protein [Autumnicola edwardsiae]|uniref:Uncharacterized protein n=1 Tax=Autumnicola edwardsiae TaxID=3075594 RepID=A0ABU3CXM9_9FLAO|nr:DUF2683 family protein [Zunongwangia sp. F297]MDT0651122.1 hypothetical protein [Zunongwangia sp. F297]